MGTKLRKVVVTFPCLPYSELNPNNLRRSHWGKRSQVSQIAREEAYLIGRQLGVSPPIEHCEVEYVFTVPTRVKRDYDGLIGACKAWLDGLTMERPPTVRSPAQVGCGIIQDDDIWHVVRISASIKYQKGVAKTEIILQEVDEQK